MAATESNRRSASLKIPALLFRGDSQRYPWMQKLKEHLGKIRVRYEDIKMTSLKSDKWGSKCINYRKKSGCILKIRFCNPEKCIKYTPIQFKQT